MQFAGRFRVVRRGDRVVSGRPPKTLSARGSSLNVRFFPWDKSRAPLLLVNAPRKTGPAVDRNKFRRRVRMAFLAVLRRYPALFDTSFVLWVRPARESPKGCRIDYREIEKQLELSLSYLRRP